jgi:hypothetical protein
LGCIGFARKGAQRPQALFIYSQTLRNGYVVWGGYSLDLPRAGWRGPAANQVYSNGVASVYVG